jgi:hypothetical protein
MLFIIILLICLHTVFATGLLRGSCDKKRYTDIAKTIKSPNTMYYVVSIISLKTRTSPHLVADCLGFIWHKDLQQNKYKIQTTTLR